MTDDKPSRLYGADIADAIAILKGTGRDTYRGMTLAQWEHERQKFNESVRASIERATKNNTGGTK